MSQQFNFRLLFFLVISFILCRAAATANSTQFRDKNGAEIADTTHKKPELKHLVLEGAIPKKIIRMNDIYPLSDQENNGSWERLNSLSDEFENGFDSVKWRRKPADWSGRVSKFYENNVQVYDGMLHIFCKKEKHPQYPESNYTAAMCRANKPVKYGYFEIEAKPMNSAASSAFWFYNHHAEKHWWTEIDVFELSGSSRKDNQAHKLNMNAHKFKLPKEPAENHVQYHAEWDSPELLRNGFHTYGLEWNKDFITWYFNGYPVYKLENRFWHQPLYLIFDTEIFTDWFGWPTDESLPGDFQVKYVRAWTK